ncbi:matrix metallopeptidase 19 [Branchiostoma belcheri]|nr:matrix metallopeptidase 19 [Branchiostoma belcheri]
MAKLAGLAVLVLVAVLTRDVANAAPVTERVTNFSQKDDPLVSTDCFEHLISKQTWGVENRNAFWSAVCLVDCQKSRHVASFSTQYLLGDCEHCGSFGGEGVGLEGATTT